jgi:Short C-terminal domain
MHPLHFLLDLTPESRTTLFEQLAILIIIVVVGGIFIMMLRRKLTAQNVDEGDQGFSLSDLRKMRDRGEITPEEYEATRARVITSVKASFDKKPGAKRGRSGNDPGPDAEQTGHEEGG